MCVMCICILFRGGERGEVYGGGWAVRERMEGEVDGGDEKALRHCVFRPLHIIESITSVVGVETM